jgi:hypothetical protein
MARPGVLNGAGADQLAELVQANGLADVELQQHQHRTAQETFSGLKLGLRHDGMILPRRCESNKTGTKGEDWQNARSSASLPVAVEEKAGAHGSRNSTL